MNYQIKILILSFLASLAVSFVAIPILRRLKVGQIERAEGPQSHLKKQGTPTMGRNNYDYFNSNSICIYVYRVF